MANAKAKRGTEAGGRPQPYADCRRGRCGLAKAKAKQGLKAEGQPQPYADCRQVRRGLAKANAEQGKQAELGQAMRASREELQKLPSENR